MYLSRKATSLLGSVIIAFVVSCNGGSLNLQLDESRPLGPAHPGAEDFRTLDFKFLNPTVKLAADSTPAKADGSEFVADLPHLNVAAATPSAQFSSPFSYAIYALQPSIQESWLGVYLEYASDPYEQEVWVGLADYGNLRWDWEKTDDWYHFAGFENPDKYISPEGITYVAVVGWNAEVMLRSVSVDLTYGLGGENIRIDWGLEVGDITGRGKNYARVPAYSNAGKPWPTPTYDDPETPDYYVSGFKWQCPEFCDRFIYRIWDFDTCSMRSITATGAGAQDGAWKWYYQPMRKDILPEMSQHENGVSTQPPRPGDIVVWRYSGPEDFGHVAAIKKVELAANKVVCVQQNVYDGSSDGWFEISVQKIGNAYRLTSGGWLNSDTRPILGWIHYGNFIPKDSFVPTPTGFDAIALFGKIKLFWDSLKFPSSADGSVDNYILLRDGIPIQYPPVDMTSFEDAVGGSGPYQYTLLAQDNGQCGNSATLSASPLIPLSTPTGISCSQGSVANKIHISWNPVPGAATYDVYAGGDNDPTYTGITATSYDDVSIPASSGYGRSYRIRAVAGSNTSDSSSFFWGWAGKEPLSTLTSNEVSGPVPLEVRFDASGSHDLDGQSGTGPIEDFRWDFDGDGVYNESTSAPIESVHLGESVPLITFANPGTYNVTVRVTDDDGINVVSNLRTITASGTYSVSGYVTKLDLGDGIDNVTLTMNPGNFQTQTESDGSFTITNVPNNTYTLTPTKTGWHFDDPPSRTVEVDGQSVSGQNFIGESAPAVTLSADPDSGQPPLNVEFTASGSDPDGGSLSYDWDWENDGTFDKLNGASVESHQYTAQGTYTCRVRVTDQEDEIALDTCEVVVDPPNTWIASGNVQVSGQPLTGVTVIISGGASDSDVTDANGNWEVTGLLNGDYTATPSLAGWSFSPTDYNFSIANSDFLNIDFTAQQDWSDPLILDSVATSGDIYSSLAIVNGYPAISYYDQISGALKYVRAINASGTSWGTPISVDSEGYAGSYSCLKVVNGYPAISYQYPSGQGTLRYVRAQDANGSSWGSPVSLDEYGGQWTSMGIVDGNPAVAYYDYSVPALMYVRADNANGSSWGSPVEVHTVASGNVGEYCSLAVVNGRPAISYHRYFSGGGGSLLYVRATDNQGSSWGSPVTLHSQSTTGLYTSLLVVDGKPAVSYYDWNIGGSSGGKLRYIRAQDADGTTWDVNIIVDPESALVGNGTSMMIVDGNPAIAYLNSGDEDLRYVQASDAQGTSWGSPQTLDSSGLVGRSCSLVVVNGEPGISYLDRTDGSDGHLKFIRRQ